MQGGNVLLKYQKAFSVTFDLNTQLCRESSGGVSYIEVIVVDGGRVEKLKIDQTDTLPKREKHERLPTTFIRKHLCLFEAKALVELEEYWICLTVDTSMATATERVHHERGEKEDGFFIVLQNQHSKSVTDVTGNKFLSTVLVVLNDYHMQKWLFISY